MLFPSAPIGSLKDLEPCMHRQQVLNYCSYTVSGVGNIGVIRLRTDMTMECTQNCNGEIAHINSDVVMSDRNINVHADVATLNMCSEESRKQSRTDLKEEGT